MLIARKRIKGKELPSEDIYSAIVIFSDISGWSKGDAKEQKRQVEKLIDITRKHLKRLERSGVEPFWLKGTGDGWAIAFPDMSNIFHVLKFAINVYEDVLKSGELKIRIGFTHGLVVQYINRLTRREDICGPAVIEGRRLIEAASPNEFLIKEEIARQLISINRRWKKHLIPRVPVYTKYGERINVYRYVSSIETEGYDVARYEELTGFLDIAKSLGHGPNKWILSSESRMRTKLCAIDGLILLWMDSRFKGLPADSIYLSPPWEPDRLKRTGVPDPLGDLDERFLEIIRPLLPKYLKEIREDQNRPKVWIKEIRYPLTDRPFLELTLGGSDYRRNKALEEAFVNPVVDKKTLRDLYEEGRFNLLNDLPNMVVTHTVMRTRDGNIVVAQRGRKQVDYAQGRFSPSCEEHWDPSKDKYPYDTVLRCLSEEWNLDEDHGVSIDVGHIKLLAIGREWGLYWTTVLIYAVDLPCTSDEVLKCWDMVPEDRAEASGIGVIPIRDHDSRCMLLKTLKLNEVRPRHLENECGAKWAGICSDNIWHETTGAARILLGLAHWYGLKELKACVQDIHCA